MTSEKSWKPSRAAHLSPNHTQITTRSDLQRMFRGQLLLQSLILLRHGASQIFLVRD